MHMVKILVLMAALIGSFLGVTGCGKKQTEPAKPTTEHTEGDGHDHSADKDHSGHNH